MPIFILFDLSESRIDKMEYYSRKKDFYFAVLTKLFNKKKRWYAQSE